MAHEYRQGLEILYQAYNIIFKDQDIPNGMDTLMQGLNTVKQKLPEAFWNVFCIDICGLHPLKDLLYQDPVTYHAYSRPRGYPGDAALIDYFYGLNGNGGGNGRVTKLGRSISDYLFECPSASSVRWRAKLIARMIDDLAGQNPAAEIMSVACGHFREALQSEAIKQNAVKRVVAFDQDEASLQQIRQEKITRNVECVNGNIRQLITKKLQLGRFDFIYSAGLYDYLNDKVAFLLTLRLMNMLKENGRLLIANFMPETKECGYMQAFMHWKLLYRTRDQFTAIFEPLHGYISNVFYDENNYVVYIEFRRP